MNLPLFDKGSPEAPAPTPVEELPTGRPRLRIPQRNQVQVQWLALDELLEPEHVARIVWGAVCELDLSRWLGSIKAVEGNVGRDANDPRLLVALWVYATLDAVGSARELARLCEVSLPYRWLCGGVSVNYHTLSDFRSRNSAAWDDLLTHLVGTLLAAGLVTLQRVSQDGMRVRADAGKASFRRRPTLEKCLAEAREQVQTLRKLAEESPEELTKRQRAARERAAREREARLEEALRNCEQLQQQREQRAKKSGQPVKEARTSTTDAEARVMQFSDGGYRPGYNVQFATDADSGVIVGVDVVNAGSDLEQLPPMLDQLQQRCGQTPGEMLVDGGFASTAAIENAAARGVIVYAPLKEEAKQLADGKDPHARKPGDSDAVAAWRARMGTELAKTIYRLRCQTAEWVNAQARNRGLQRMPVRGRTKCRTIAVLYAIAHNLVVARRLQKAMTA
jgi:transposase